MPHVDAWLRRGSRDSDANRAGLAETPVAFPQHSPIEQIAARSARRLDLKIERGQFPRRHAARTHLGMADTEGYVIDRTADAETITVAALPCDVADTRSLRVCGRGCSPDRSIERLADIRSEVDKFG